MSRHVVLHCDREYTNGDRVIGTCAAQIPEALAAAEGWQVGPVDLCSAHNPARIPRPTQRPIRRRGQ